MLHMYVNNMFYIVFSFMFFTRYIGFDVPSEGTYILYLIGKVGAFSLSLLLILREVLSKKVSVKLLLLMIFIVYISLSTADFFILISFITVWAMRDIKIERLLYIGLWLSFASLLYTIAAVLFKYGIYGTFDYIIDERFGMRLSLNYPHPNAFPYRFFIFLCLYTLIRKKISFLEMLFFGGIIYLIYTYSGSRTSFFASLFMLLSIYILQYIRYIRTSIIRIGIIYSYTIVTLFSIFSALFFVDYEMLNTLNSLSSGRVNDSYGLFKELGISFFPRNISDILNSLNSPMDNFYNYTLISSGIIFIALFNIATIYLLKLMYRYELYKEVVVLCFVGIYSVLEKGMLDISLNILLIYYALLMHKEKITHYKKVQKS